MPLEVGGTGDRVTPGWLLRAGLASCLATRIAMQAATEGIELDSLDVVASSRSDTRGLLGIPDGDGANVPAGPRDVQLRVRIAARNVAPRRLRELVERSKDCSPISAALQTVLPVALHVDTQAG